MPTNRREFIWNSGGGGWVVVVHPDDVVFTKPSQDVRGGRWRRKKSNSVGNGFSEEEQQDEGKVVE